MVRASFPRRTFLRSILTAGSSSSLGGYSAMGGGLVRSHHGSYMLSSLAFHRATIPKSLSSERQFKYSFHKLVSCLGEHLVDHTSKKCPASADLPCISGRSRFGLRAFDFRTAIRYWPRPLPSRQGDTRRKHSSRQRTINGRTLLAASRNQLKSPPRRRKRYVTPTENTTGAAVASLAPHPPPPPTDCNCRHIARARACPQNLPVGGYRERPPGLAHRVIP